MAFDYSKLRGRIVERFTTAAAFAEAMGISTHTISNKLNSKKHWKDYEIAKACDLLGIEPVEIPDYFFAVKVQY